MRRYLSLLLFIGLSWGQDDWEYFTSDPMILNIDDNQNFIWVSANPNGKQIIKIHKQTGSQEYFYVSNYNLDSIKTIFVDSIGLWFAGEGSDRTLGLIEHYDYPNQVQYFSIYSTIEDIAYDSTNNIYLLATSEGIKYFNQADYIIGDSIEFSNINNSFQPSNIHSKSNGTFYCNSNTNRVNGYQYIDSTETFYLFESYHTENSALTGNRIVDIDFDSENRLRVISQQCEVFLYDGISWQYFNQYNSPIIDSLSFTTLAIDDNDNIYIGSYFNGIYKYDGTNWTVYNSYNSGLLNNKVNVIHKDYQNNTKWIGTHLAGLMAYNEEGLNLKAVGSDLYGINHFKILNAFPNPFNPTTTLSYELPEDSFVDVTVYDMLGNVVNNLVNTYQSPGYKSVQWNATNNQGQPVSAGVYLYSIEAGNFRKTKKMVLLK